MTLEERNAALAEINARAIRFVESQQRYYKRNRLGAMVWAGGEQRWAYYQQQLKNINEQRTSYESAVLEPSA